MEQASKTTKRTGFTTTVKYGMLKQIGEHIKTNNKGDIYYVNQCTECN